MKFRIVKYYERYEAQVLKDGKYIHIGSPNGYFDVASAKLACERYKAELDDYIVEEFEL